jgi:hypothetical protein
MPRGLSVTNGELVQSRSQTRLRDVTHGTSHTFLVCEKHVPVNKFGQSGPTWGDGVRQNGFIF